MDYFTTTSNAAKRAADCVIVGVYDRGKLSAGAKDIDVASNGELRRLVKSGDVSSKPGRCVLLTQLGGTRAARVAVVGLGKASEFDTRAFCRAVAAAIGSISDTRCKDLLNTLTLEAVEDSDAYYLARHTVQTIGDVLYRFTQMKSSRKDSRMPLRKIGLSVASRGDATKAMLGAKHGDAISEGVSLAKDLGNLPPNVCTPSYLARTAQKIAKGNGKLTTRIINESDMKRLGMHSAHRHAIQERRQGETHRTRRQGRDFRLGRHLSEAGTGHGRDEIRHVRRRQRYRHNGDGRGAATARQSQRRRAGRRKPAGKQGDGSGRYRQEHVRPDHRDSQYGCRGSPDPV
jgi:leucyl aminopeptidase